MKRILCNLLFCMFLVVLANQKLYCKLLFEPLLANPIEPRIGAMYQISDNRLRLDIGSSVDLYDFSIVDSSQMSIGADFYTFTRLRSEENFKFPVETTDFFFGLNSCYKANLFNLPVSARLRFAHISSHLVDGLAKDSVFSKLPYVYSREFADLTIAAQLGLFRVYAEFEYVFSRTPIKTNPIIAGLGVDTKVNLYKCLDFVAGYDFKLNGYDDTYYACHAAEAGVLINTSKYAGLMLNAFYNKGKSIHGLFLEDNDDYFGFGFRIIFY